MPGFPGFVADVLDALASSGYAAFAVGGCVRDLLLGREPHDWDVATDATDREITDIFPRTAPTGVKYGTVTVIMPGGQVEVTTFRRDGAYLNARKPDSVEFVGDVREDLARRDLTVNAMAMDRQGSIIDPFGGREDLDRRLLRCVGDPERRFSEDALRMFRLLRFSAQLGFKCDGAALAAVKRLAPLAGRLSAERVRDELIKTLTSPAPEAAALMIEYGLLSGFMSENAKIIPWERLRAVPGDMRLSVFAALAGRTGAVESAEALLTALRCPAADRRLAREAAEIGPASDGLAIRLALATRSDRAVLVSAAADGHYVLARDLLNAGAFTRVRDLAVTGEDLKRLPAKAIGPTLRALALAVTAGKVPNSRRELLKLAYERSAGFPQS